jgi:hypothetical protein
MGGFDPRAVDARAALSLGYLIVFGSIAGFTAYVWLMQRCSAVKVSTHNFVNPVVAVLIGWAFAGERLTPRMMLAGGVIVLAILLIYGVRRKHGTAQPAEQPPAQPGKPVTEGGTSPPAGAVRRPTAAPVLTPLPYRLRPGVRS